MECTTLPFTEEIKHDMKFSHGLTQYTLQKITLSDTQ